MGNVLSKDEAQAIEKAIEKDGRAKVVRCICGDKVTMACVMPLAETDAEIIREFRKYAQEGRKIEYLELNTWEWCGGNCQPKTGQLNLFE